MNKEKDNKKVVLGLSGGVDSAVAAYLLKEQGYEVFCVYLKNWTEPDEKGICPALADREDAMRVAAKLDLPFQTVDYEQQYRDRVFVPFIEGLDKGVNPNPDILCNPLVKFEALLAVADDIGAAFIATGHYAQKIVCSDTSDARCEVDGRTPAGARSRVASSVSSQTICFLKAGSDNEKDQSYFLSRITGEQLSRTIFPLGEMNKTQVREIAKKIGLHVADKEGTSGICFIGERNFENFMKDKVVATPGVITDTDGNVLGEHRGLPFYTVGQRHGFGCVSAKLDTVASATGVDPYYVAKKEQATNTLVVARAYDPALFRASTQVIDPHWISGKPTLPLKCLVRLRYRQPLQSCTVLSVEGSKLNIVFNELQKAVTPGQYAAFYDGDICLGSAVIV